MGDIGAMPDVKEAVEDEVCGELAREAEGGKDYLPGILWCSPRLKKWPWGRCRSG